MSTMWVEGVKWEQISINFAKFQLISINFAKFQPISINFGKFQPISINFGKFQPISTHFQTFPINFHQISTNFESFPINFQQIIIKFQQSFLIRSFFVNLISTNLWEFDDKSNLLFSGNAYIRTNYSKHLLLLLFWRVSLTYRVKSAHKLKLTDQQLLSWMLPIIFVMAVYLGAWTLSATPHGETILTGTMKFTQCSYNWWDHSLAIGKYHWNCYSESLLLLQLYCQVTEIIVNGLIW